MTRKNTTKKRGFFWRGILILLPVAALALAGFSSMRQDRLLVEQEAQNQARRLAEEINRNIADAIDKLNRGANFENWVDTNLMVLKLDSRGNLVVPPPLESAPSPCLSTNMTPDQARLWKEAHESEFVNEDPERACAAWKALIDTSPGTNIMAEAWYRLGLLQATNNPAEGKSALMQVIRNFPGASLESGLPARAMAQLQWLRHHTESGSALSPEMPSLDELCREVVESPTLVSPLILAEADNLKSKKGLTTTNDWTALWQRQEQDRLRHNAFVSQCADALSLNSDEAGFPGEPRYCLLKTRERWWMKNGRTRQWSYSESEKKWLTSLKGTKGGMLELNGIPQQELEAILARIIEPILRSSPYLGFIVEFAGSQVLLCRCFDMDERRIQLNYLGGIERIGGRLCIAWYNLINNNSTTAMVKLNTDNLAILNRSFNTAPLLVAAERSSGGKKFLSTRIYLSYPSILYEGQRSRSLRFGLLIAAALATALGALFSAWRAFDKQARLVELKGNFVSSVSHEMRAPIASIRLMAEGLESGRIRDEPKKKEYFRFIVQECRRLSGLIENVLDFARIDQGRLKLTWQVADIPELVRQTAAILTPAAAEKGVSLVVSLPAVPDKNGDLTATVDERAIQQVLLNLIDNAIKHSQAGSAVEIGIEPIGAQASATNEDKWFKKRIRIWVQDHGQGIPVADQKHIFEAFYRSGMELRRRTQGTGLGLTIVKHLVEAHHGTVSFQSAPGQGARFTVELP
jgi:signal transduction histidine kinase